MDLDEFQWKMRLTNADVSRKTGAATTSISKIKLREHSPNLFLVTKLLYLSDGRIKPEELLGIKDLEELEEWKKATKKCSETDYKYKKYSRKNRKKIEKE